MNLLKKLLSKATAPLVFVGGALVALVMVLFEVFGRGHRAGKLKKEVEDAKQDLANVDDATARGDLDWLDRDISRRVERANRRHDKN